MLTRTQYHALGTNRAQYESRDMEQRLHFYFGKQIPCNSEKDPQLCLDSLWNSWSIPTTTNPKDVLKNIFRSFTSPQLVCYIKESNSSDTRRRTPNTSIEMIKDESFFFRRSNFLRMFYTPIMMLPAKCRNIWRWFLVNRSTCVGS